MLSRRAVRAGGAEESGTRTTMTQLDTVIRDGTVVDGTGRPARRADVGIADGRIVEVGKVTGRGRREISADGLLVTPGWVDVHTHYDGQVSWDTEMAPSSLHGVTTAIMGNCGVGFAPVRPDRHDWLIALMEGVEDIPGTALAEGITWEWETFPEYLDAVGRIRRTIDVGAQVPHAALRGYVMGDRGGAHTEVPTAAEIREMGRMVAEAMEAGALGFSTSRTVVHKSADGSPTPTLTATHAELLGIAEAMGRSGAGVIEAVSDFQDLDAEFAILRDMVAVSGRPLSMSILQRPGLPADEYRRILALIAAARADGLPIHGQVAPRPVGLVLCLEGGVDPLRGSPTYDALASLAQGTRLAELRRPEVRAQVVGELTATPRGQIEEMLSRAFALERPARYDQRPDQSIAAQAAALGAPPIQVAYDTLVRPDGPGAMYVPVMNFVEGNLDAVRTMLADPHTVPGLGDAGAHCTLICDGSFATHLLSYWGRDAPPAQQFPLEWIVQRQCADTAALMGLGDRGRLAPGLRADVNVIDLEHLSLGLPEIVQDLPAGGKRLLQRATGYQATLVAGTCITEQGELTGALPGRLVRGAAAGVPAAP